MADDHGILPLLGLLLDASLYGRHDAPSYAERIAELTGYDAEAGPEAAEKMLREALGLKTCRCMVDGPGEVLPLACPVHGTPCEFCGGLESCTQDCAGEPAGFEPGTRVPVIATMTESTGGQVRFGVLGGGVLIGCDSLPVILGEDAKQEEFAQLFADACNRAAAARAVTPGQVPSAPRTYYACCIHCEHNGESDPGLDDERHPNPCREGCRAVTAGQVTP